MIKAEDFQDWLDSPVTRWVLEAHKDFAGRLAQEWFDMSWNGGTADEKALIERKSRADAYLAIAEMTFERMTELDDPKAD